jgi:hypothetical protein
VVVEQLRSAATAVTGMDEVGLALRLTGMRSPDAQLYVLLANLSNPPAAGGVAQWVKTSARQLCVELGGSTKARVRTALERLRVLGLIEVRRASPARLDREYRVEMARANAAFEQLRQQAVHAAAWRDACAVRPASPMAPLVRLAVPRLDAGAAERTAEHDALLRERLEQVSAVLLDRTASGLEAVITALQDASWGKHQKLAAMDEDVRKLLH